MQAAGLLLCVLAACLTAKGCSADNHHCSSPGQVLTVQKGKQDRLPFDASLHPRFLEEPDDDVRQCQLKIDFVVSGSENQQLVLQAVLDQSEETYGKAVQHLNRTDLKFGWLHADTPVTAGMFHVYPLRASRQLLVESNWNPRTHRSSEFNLRLLLPQPGNCGSDMLSFRGNCYAVSGVQQTAAAAMASIRGDAQLASFTSMAEIGELIKANAARLSGRQGFTPPLGLSRPVRLGMFYRAVDDAVLHLVRSDSGCGLQPVPSPQEMKVPGGGSGKCASLMVDSETNGPIIEFGDCGTPMRSLVSFPETAESSDLRATANCSTEPLRLDTDRSTTKNRVRSRIFFGFRSSSAGKLGSVANSLIVLSVCLMLERFFYNFC